MPKNAKELIYKWIEAVNNEGKGLTAWETQFMESITDQYYSTEHISDRQLEILERIYAEKTL